jgi:hypothetical protein
MASGNDSFKPELTGLEERLEKLIRHHFRNVFVKIKAFHGK